MKKTTLLVLLTIAVFQLGEGQDKRLRRDDLSVKVRVIVASLDSGYFRYSYLFQNSASSHQSMSAAIVDLNDEWSDYGGSLRNSVAPTEKDWGKFPTVGKKMRWVPSYDTTGLDALEWVPLNSVQPGEHLSFSFEAIGLPSIGNFWAEGWAPWFFSQHQHDSLLLEGIPESDLHLKDENFLKGETVVPRSLMEPFFPIRFIDTLASLISRSRSLGWITDETTSAKYLGFANVTKSQLETNDFAGVRNTLESVLHSADIDSSSTLASEAYALIRYNTEYLLARLPSGPPPGLVVKLINSAETKLAGGDLQYYAGSWKDVTNNNDGTFSVTTDLKTLSLRMTYDGGNTDKQQDIGANPTVVFQTVNASVQLQNSQGVAMDEGTVQYYSGGWWGFGVTSNGVVAKELLPNNYSFRMTYAYASNDKQQNIGTSPNVLFQTVNASVQLQNSQGNPIDQGTVQYYSGAWREFGTTLNGIAAKELLPNNYPFRMTYEFVSNDKSQDIGANGTVSFSTVLCDIRVRNSQNQPVNDAIASYYSGAWRTIGPTVNGNVTKELLPANLTFRVRLGAVSQDKAQNIGSNSLVEFVVQ